jgi:hypothetical protein
MDQCGEHRFIADQMKSLHDKTDLVKVTVDDIYKALRGDLKEKGWLTRIESSEKSIKTIYRAAVWFLSIFGIAVFSFIGGLLTGAIEVTYKHLGVK